MQRKNLTDRQAAYSADMLYILALAISKVAVLVLLWHITPIAMHRRVTFIVGSFIAVWTFASFFASAFQCSLPDTWTILSQDCFDRVWIAVLKMLHKTAYTPADLILDSIRCYKYTDRSRLDIVANLYYLELAHVRSAESGGYRVFRDSHFVRITPIVATKWLSISVRVIGAIIAQLTLLIRQRGTSDATLDTWSYYLSMQFVQTFSVITACVPYIKNVLLGVESGMFQTGHFGLATLHKSPQRTQEHGSSAPTSGIQNAVGLSRLGSHQSRDPISRDVLKDETSTNNPFSPENTATAESVTPVEEWDGGSQSSRTNIIRETREWYIDYEGIIDL